MKTAVIQADHNMAAHWHRVGPKLDHQRRWELRNFDYEAHRAAIDALLEIACSRAVPRVTSGLVELQRLLAKGRR